MNEIAQRLLEGEIPDLGDDPTEPPSHGGSTSIPVKVVADYSYNDDYGPGGGEEYKDTIRALRRTLQDPIVLNDDFDYEYDGCGSGTMTVPGGATGEDIIAELRKLLPPHFTIDADEDGLCISEGHREAVECTMCGGNDTEYAEDAQELADGDGWWCNTCGGEFEVGD
jgi:hypothetical protein